MICRNSDLTNSRELNKKALFNRLHTSIYWLWTIHETIWINESRDCSHIWAAVFFYAQLMHSWAPECAKLSVQKLFGKNPNLADFLVNKHIYRRTHKMLQIDRQMNWIFATNSNILIPVSLQPNVTYLCKWIGFYSVSKRIES